MSYYLFDAKNWAFAKNDKTGEVFLVTKNGLKKSPTKIDPAWDKISKEEAESLAM